MTKPVITSKDENPSDDYEVSHDFMAEEPNLAGDRLNLCLMLFLYIVQGIPIGLCNALMIIMQSRGMVSYNDQAIFSIAQWPYILKLLLAPLVDALYVQRIGRRKSWLLPLQLLMGSFFIYLANNVDGWIPESGKPNLKMIVLVVFVINLLSATQDIVVDGWSLTILKKKNVSYSSICNSVGVPLGMFFGSVCFTLLVSDKFSITYFGTEPSAGGIVSMKSFLYFCGVCILLMTLLIGLFKKEKDHRLEHGYVITNVCQSYQLLLKILKLRRIRVLAIALFSARVGFSAMDTVSNLKLIDAGISKDNIMLITSVMYVLKLIMPIFITKYITSTKPMSYYLSITPIRLLWAIAYIGLIGYTQTSIRNYGTIVPIYYYISLTLVFLINEILSFFMFLTLMSFFTRISDPHFGGTYMSVYNTFYSLGYLVSNTLVLKLVNAFTFSVCSNDADNSCFTSNFKLLCHTYGGSCTVNVDGYYITIVICMIVGFVWYIVFKNIINSYQNLNLSHWTVKAKQLNVQEVDMPCVTTVA